MIDPAEYQMLQGIVGDHPDVARDPRKCRAILADLLPQAGPQVRVLTLAVELGICEDLVRAREEDLSRVIAVGIQRLVNEAIDGTAAEWAVQAWASALVRHQRTLRNPLGGSAASHHASESSNRLSHATEAGITDLGQSSFSGGMTGDVGARPRPKLGPVIRLTATMVAVMTCLAIVGWGLGTSSSLIVIVMWIAGCATNIVIERLPRHLDSPNRYGESWETWPWTHVVRTKGHCSVCGSESRPFENSALLGWVIHRNECCSCGSTRPISRFLVEFGIPIMGLVAISVAKSPWQLAAVLLLIPPSFAVWAIDVETMIIPTSIVWPTFLISIVVVVFSAFSVGNMTSIMDAAVGSFALAAPLFVFWWSHPRAIGFGNVRLAVLLGWNIGFLASDSYTAVKLSILTLMLAVALFLTMLAVSKRTHRRVPSAPNLLVAAATCLVLAGSLS